VSCDHAHRERTATASQGDSKWSDACTKFGIMEILKGSHSRDPTSDQAACSPTLVAGNTNIVRTLSELQGDDPLILTLARGKYRPKEHQQDLELAANYPKIAVAYTQVVTIATDDHHTLQEFRGSVGAQGPFSRAQLGRSKRTSASRNTPTPSTIR
jgi:hypothetical protein